MNGSRPAKSPLCKPSGPAMIFVQVRTTALSPATLSFSSDQASLGAIPNVHTSFFSPSSLQVPACPYWAAVAVILLLHLLTTHLLSPHLITHLLTTHLLTIHLLSLHFLTTHLLTTLPLLFRCISLPNRPLESPNTEHDTVYSQKPPMAPICCI